MRANYNGIRGKSRPFQPCKYGVKWSPTFLTGAPIKGTSLRIRIHSRHGAQRSAASPRRNSIKLTYCNEIRRPRDARLLAPITSASRLRLSRGINGASNQRARAPGRKRARRFLHRGVLITQSPRGCALCRAVTRSFDDRATLGPVLLWIIRSRPT